MSLFQTISSCVCGHSAFWTVCRKEEVDESFGKCVCKHKKEIRQTGPSYSTVQHPQSLTFGQVEVNQERSVNLRAVIYAQIQQVLVLNKRSTNRLCNKTLHIMRHYHRYSYHRGVWCLTPSAAYTYVSQFFSIKPALTITKSPCDVSEAHNCHLLTGITKIQHWPKNHLMFFCIEIIPQKSELRHQFNHSTDIISSYCPTLYAY